MIETIRETGAEQAAMLWRREPLQTMDHRDDELLRRAIAGDRSAAETLLSPHQLPLYRLCRGMLLDADDAEDAVQETFFRALRSLSRFQGRCALQTWLFRIALNVCIEWKRRRPETAILAEPRGHHESAEDAALRTIHTLDALRILPHRRRAIVLVREAEGWSIPEIAEALGWKPKRVENELYKARIALAKWREQNGIGDET